MDNVQGDLVQIALDLCADAGRLAEMVKKFVYHGHAMDQRAMQAALNRVKDDWLLAKAWLDGAAPDDSAAEIIEEENENPYFLHGEELLRAIRQRQGA